MMGETTRDEAARMLPDPGAGCSCTPFDQDAGGGYIEHLLDYDPACPEHSVHLYDPLTGTWVLRDEVMPTAIFDRERASEVITTIGQQILSSQFFNDAEEAALNSLAACFTPANVVSLLVDGSSAAEWKAEFDDELARARSAEAKVREAENKLYRIAAVFKPEWLEDQWLPQYLGAEADAREDAIKVILAEKTNDLTPPMRLSTGGDSITDLMHPTPAHNEPWNLGDLS